jgi:hypothetical protein
MSTKQVVTAQNFIDMLDLHFHSVDAITVAENKIEALLSKARAEARREGRMEGLKEMDKSWRTSARSVEALRAEYQGDKV